MKASAHDVSSAGWSAGHLQNGAFDGAAFSFSLASFVPFLVVFFALGFQVRIFFEADGQKPQGSGDNVLF